MFTIKPPRSRLSLEVTKKGTLEALESSELHKNVLVGRYRQWGHTHVRCDRKCIQVSWRGIHGKVGVDVVERLQ